jgi:glycosyltransferase involved in cell wall biosynthesis
VVWKEREFGGFQAAEKLQIQSLVHKEDGPIDMNVLHNVSFIGKRSFGLGPVAWNLAKEQSNLGSNVKIWSVDNTGDICWAMERSGLPENTIRQFQLLGPHMLWFSPQMELTASSPEGGNFDVVHQHGIWTGVSRATSKLCKTHKIPSVIAPHGSLSSWTLNLSRWKKRLALAAYEGQNLHGASCLHATAETEITDFRDFGLRNPIALINNGVAERSSHTAGDGNRFRSQHGIPAGRRILLFLSRITPKKGLPMLIEAIVNMKQEFADWMLVIAGTDEFSHKTTIETLIELWGLKDAITMVGPLYDQAKSDAFDAAELFVLPSHSEGAPIVILESLLAGVPVITTKASPWAELNTHGCGWWVDISTDSICGALRHAAGLSPDQLISMGKQGEKLVISKYIWMKQAQKTITLYEWLLGLRDMPDFVLVH